MKVYGHDDPGCCDECGRVKSPAVEFEIVDHFVACTALICLDCLQDAVELAKGGPDE